MNTDFSDDDARTVRPRPDAPSDSGQRGGVSTALSVLLVDDNRHVAESLALALRLAGHMLERAEGPEAALSLLAERRFDVVLLDLNYAAGRTDGEEGLALLARIVADDPAARVVVITAHSGIRVAVAAMRAGACDFVMKPWRNADLIATLTAVARRAPPAAEAPAVIADPSAEPVRLIGESAAIERVRDLIRRIGPTMAGVVVTGAPGTGRSLVAAALHAASPFAATPMVEVDLRDPPAWARIDGATGTLLLRHPDRLGEVEQERLRQRLPAAARLIAIADSAAAIGPSLAHRLATIAIPLPPLAARGDDALILARHLARIAARRHGRPAPRWSPAAEAAVRAGSWPGEVRGLAAAIERAVLLGEDDAIDPALVSPAVAAAPPAAPEAAAPPSRFDLDENERAVIEAALREHHHNVTHAATALGLSRGALYRRMARHGL